MVRVHPAVPIKSNTYQKFQGFNLPRKSNWEGYGKVKITSGARCLPAFPAVLISWPCPVRLLPSLPRRNAPTVPNKVACGCDPQAIALYDRWLATTLSAAGGKDEAVAIAMFTRLAIALEVMIDMKGWPAGIVAGLTAARRASRIHAGG